MAVALDSTTLSRVQILTRALAAHPPQVAHTGVGSGRVDLPLDRQGNTAYVRNMSNNEIYDLDALADVFKALANPNRLRIFYRLASCCTPGTVGFIDGRDSVYVGELGEELAIVKSTVSHHIKELRQVGLIRTQRQGQKIACWVDPGLVERLRAFFTF